MLFHTLALRTTQRSKHFVVHRHTLEIIERANDSAAFNQMRVRLRMASCPPVSNLDVSLYLTN